MKIVFLSNGNNYSNQALKFLNSHKGNILIKHLNENRFIDYPEVYDLGISFLYPYLVPEKEIIKANWINFHPAALPNYGGRNIAYHTIMNGESEAGGTIHYMDKTFDTGDIIDVKMVSINNMTAFEVYNKSCNILLSLLKEYLPKFLNGEKVHSTKQKTITYYKNIQINDFIEISELNKKKILALTYPPYYPKIEIEGRFFTIVPDNNLLN